MNLKLWHIPLADLDLFVLVDFDAPDHGGCFYRAIRFS